MYLFMGFGSLSNFNHIIKFEYYVITFSEWNIISDFFLFPTSVSENYITYGWFIFYDFSVPSVMLVQEILLYAL